MKPLTTALSWTRGQVSLAFTVAAVTVAFCSPFIGRLLDRFSARRIIIPCTVVYGLAFASLSLLTKHLEQFIATFVVMGIVGNGTTALGYARVVSAWFVETRGRALAAVMTGSAAGSMIFPPLAQWLISAYGWRTAYALLGALILLMGVPLTAAFLQEPSELEAPVHARQCTPRSAGILRDLFSISFLCIGGALVLFSLSTNGLEAHLPPLLTDKGFLPARAAAILSLAGFASLVSRIVTGYMLDRFFAPYLVAVLFLVSAAGFLLILYGASVGVAAIGAICLGAGLGAESDAVPYLLTRFFGLERFSELYGYTWSAYAIAGASGPLIMGSAFDRTGSYRGPLLVFCGLVIVAACLLACLPDYRKDRSAKPDSVQDAADLHPA